MSSKRRAQPGTLIGGLGLLVIGAALSAQFFGYPPPSFSLIWPGIPILVGLVLLAQPYTQSIRRSGLIFFGVLALFSGLFFCAFTFQIGRLTWPQMIDYWPVFPAILGFAFLMVYIAEDMQHEALLRPAYLIGGFGIFLLPITAGAIGGPAIQQIARFWPVLFIPVVLLILMQIVRSRGQSRKPD